MMKFWNKMYKNVLMNLKQESFLGRLKSANNESNNSNLYF